jgi:hypothetical protein
MPRLAPGSSIKFMRSNPKAKGHIASGMSQLSRPAKAHRALHKKHPHPPPRFASPPIIAQKCWSPCSASSACSPSPTTLAKIAPQQEPAATARAPAMSRSNALPPMSNAMRTGAQCLVGSPSMDSNAQLLPWDASPHVSAPRWMPSLTCGPRTLACPPPRWKKTSSRVSELLRKGVMLRSAPRTYHYPFSFLCSHLTCCFLCPRTTYLPFHKTSPLATIILPSLSYRDSFHCYCLRSLVLVIVSSLTTLTRPKSP